MVFDKIKRAFSKSLGNESSGEDYVEIDLGGKEEMDQKVFVKLFLLKDYEEVNPILNSLREGYTIAVIDIKTLRQRDPIELKRAVAKIKKTTDAMEGNIAGFGENVIIVTPSFAKIHKEAMPKPKEDRENIGSRWD
ncbi:MAG: cell division protein SepF [Candidatus Pacearchaeota archaeon]|jgi:SepF-like predicted cell division protein (DUF552 family)